MPWSSWFSPPPDDFRLSRAGVATAGRVVSEDSVVDSRTFPAIFEADRSTIVAGGGGDAASQAGMAGALAVVDVSASRSGGTTSAAVILGQGVFGLLGSRYADTFDWLPPELAALTLGVDYGVRPDRVSSDDDAYVQYESEHTTFVRWQDWNADAAFQTWHTAPYEPAAPWTGVGFDLRLAYTTPFTGWPWALGPPPDAPFYSYGTGVSLGSVSIPVDIRSDGAYPPGTSPPHVTVPVPLSTVPVPDLALLTQPSFLDSLAVPGPTSGDPGGWSASFYLNLYDPVGNAPTIVYQRPRWRYWSLKGDAPALRMRQRDDGIGPFDGHARVTSGSLNSTTSAQRSQRIGSANTYDPRGAT